MALQFWKGPYGGSNQLFMKNGYGHHDHQDIYTYNLSVPQRFTLDVPNQSPPLLSGLLCAIRYYQVREKDPDALLLNAGDYYQGTMWYTFFKYRPVIQVATCTTRQQIMQKHESQRNISSFSVFQRAELHGNGAWKPRLWWWHLWSPAFCWPGDFKDTRKIKRLF